MAKSHDVQDAKVEMAGWKLSTRIDVGPATPNRAVVLWSPLLYPVGPSQTFLIQPSSSAGSKTEKPDELETTNINNFYKPVCSKTCVPANGLKVSQLVQKPMMAAEVASPVFKTSLPKCSSRCSSALVTSTLHFAQHNSAQQKTSTTIMGGNPSKSTNAQPQVPSNWNTADIPSQQDKVSIVTGANSGIGFEMALGLARKGAHVILACRNQERGLKAQTEIRALLENVIDAGGVEFMQVDMGNLASVRDFCDEFKKKFGRLDVLINNAGIGGGMYTTTEDGLELVFATNYLGHFALTAQLFDLLKKSAPSRVASVSSFLHWYATLVFDEDKPMARSEKEHNQLARYSISKLCLLLFTLELDRRLKAAGIENITAAAAHPGYCATKIMKKSAAANSTWFWWTMYRTSAIFPPQSAPKGALSALYAATADNVRGGDYFGPKYLEVYGHPIREDPSSLSKSETAAAKLWAYSEELTNVKFDVSK